MAGSVVLAAVESHKTQATATLQRYDWELIYKLKLTLRAYEGNN